MGMVVMSKRELNRSITAAALFVLKLAAAGAALVSSNLGHDKRRVLRFENTKRNAGTGTGWDSKRSLYAIFLALADVRKDYVWQYQ